MLTDTSTATNLQTFHAFGMVRATSKDVSATLSAMTNDGEAIVRTVKLSGKTSVSKGKVLAALVGVRFDLGGLYIGAHELSGPEETKLIQNPLIQSAIQKAADLLQKAVEIPSP